MGISIEKRRHSRFQARLQLFYEIPEAREAGQQRHRALTQDISPGGLSLRCLTEDLRFSLNQVVDLTIKIPSREYNLVRIHVVKAMAKVVRLTSPGGSDQTLVGLKFLTRPVIWRPDYPTGPSKPAARRESDPLTSQFALPPV